MNKNNNDLNSSSPPEKKTLIKHRIFQVAALILVIIISIVLISQKQAIAGLSHYGYIGIFLISVLSASTVFLPVPGIILIISFGAIFNPFWVGLISGIGSTLGEVTAYIFGYGGRFTVEQNKYYPKMVNWMQRWGGWTILVLALIPNPLFDLAGTVAGILKYPLWKFFIYGALGRIPKHFVFAFIGYFWF